MIQLTRLRHGEQFFLNPDLIERVDTHADTVVRLTTGTEHRVTESGEQIVRHIAEFRARVIALAGLIEQAASPNGADSVWAEPATPASTNREPLAELGPRASTAPTEGQSS